LTKIISILQRIFSTFWGELKGGSNPETNPVCRSAASPPGGDTPHNILIINRPDDFSPFWGELKGVLIPSNTPSAAPRHLPQGGDRPAYLSDNQ